MTTTPMALFDFPDEILSRHREIEELQRVLEDAEIEADPELEARYDQLVQELIDLEFAETKKLDGYGFRIAALKEEAAAAKARKQAIDDLKKRYLRKERRYENAADRMTQRLLAYMRLMRLPEVKGDHFDFSLARIGGGRSITVTTEDPQKVPKEFRKEVVDTEAIGTHVSGILGEIDAAVKLYEKELKGNKQLNKLDIIERVNAYREELESERLPDFVSVPQKDLRLSIR